MGCWVPLGKAKGPAGKTVRAVRWGRLMGQKMTFKGEKGDVVYVGSLAHSSEGGAVILVPRQLISFVSSIPSYFLGL